MCQIGFTVWDVYGPRTKVAVGGATLDVFGRNGVLRRGVQRLALWRGREAEGGSATPAKVASGSRMEQLEGLIKKYERGDMLRVEWLDMITIQCIEGVLDVTVDERSHLLRAGQLLFLAGDALHGVTAIEDASALVTIALRKPGAPGSTGH